MDLNKNYPLDIDSYTDQYYTKNNKKKFYGGQNNNVNKSYDFPNGGTPPIYICEKAKGKEIIEEEKSKREYTTHKSSVSIKSILEKRRDVKPFIKTT